MRRFCRVVLSRGMPYSTAEGCFPSGTERTHAGEFFFCHNVILMSWLQPKKAVLTDKAICLGCLTHAAAARSAGRHKRQLL